jgi:hypothetical protein
MNPLFDSNPRIDIAFLFGKFPDLALLERQGLSLDAIGNELIRRKLHKRSRQQRGLHAAGPEEPPEQLEWTRTKRALHEVICTGNPEFEAIRQRLRNHAGALTPHLLATLSLWLAGFLGMSLATVTPLVATVLFGIARDGIDGWFQPGEPLQA